MSEDRGIKVQCKYCWDERQLRAVSSLDHLVNTHIPIKHWDKTSLSTGHLTSEYKPYIHYYPIINDKISTVSKDTIEHELHLISKAIKSTMLFPEDGIIELLSEFAVGHIAPCDNSNCDQEIFINNQYALETDKEYIYYNINSDLDIRISEHYKNMNQIYGKYRLFFCSSACCKNKCTDNCNNRVATNSNFKSIDLCFNHRICSICNNIIQTNIGIKRCRNCSNIFCENEFEEYFADVIGKQWRNNRLCKDCMIKKETESVKYSVNAISILSSYKDIREIIAEYVIGTITKCLKCECEIAFNNQFDYLKGINAEKNIIYQYTVADTRVLKQHCIRVVYDNNVRIWCCECNPYNNVLMKCNNDGCNKYDTTLKICASHSYSSWCSECLTSIRSVIICEICDKYACSYCSVNEKCMTCYKKPIFNEKRTLLSILLPVFNDKIINILIEFSFGYILKCNGNNCLKEFVVNYKETFVKSTERYCELFHCVKIEGGMKIKDVQQIYGECIKLYCLECLNETYAICNWCGNICNLIDYCHQCEDYHCKYCKCNTEKMDFLNMVL